MNAQVLLLMRDPGPMTDSQAGGKGSGFLCVENDDATAGRLATLLDQTALSPSDCISWNAYPWYIYRAPSGRQLDNGIPPLVDLLGLLPQLRVVMLLGNEASRTWQKLRSRRPRLADRYVAIPTRHTSPQAFIGTADQRSRWRAEQLGAFRSAAAMIRGGTERRWVTTEAEVVAAFADWLQQEGWHVATELDHVDLIAHRGNDRLVAEAKGRTSDPGLDIDTAYGQLLRRMRAGTDGVTTRYALVAPETSAAALTRVPPTSDDSSASTSTWSASEAR